MINRILRDHQGYSGDGHGGVGDLPVGDRSTAQKPINKRDLREALLAYGVIVDEAALSAAQAALYDGPRLDSQADIEADTSLSNDPESPGYTPVGGYVLTRREGLSLLTADPSETPFDPDTNPTGYHRVNDNGVKLISTDGDFRVFAVPSQTPDQRTESITRWAAFAPDGEDIVIPSRLGRLDVVPGIDIGNHNLICAGETGGLNVVQGGTATDWSDTDIISCRVPSGGGAALRGGRIAGLGVAANGIGRDIIHRSGGVNTRTSYCALLNAGRDAEHLEPSASETHYIENHVQEGLQIPSPGRHALGIAIGDLGGAAEANFVNNIMLLDSKSNRCGKSLLGLYLLDSSSVPANKIGKILMRNWHGQHDEEDSIAGRSSGDIYIYRAVGSSSHIDLLEMQVGVMERQNSTSSYTIEVEDDSTVPGKSLPIKKMIDPYTLLTGYNGWFDYNGYKPSTAIVDRYDITDPLQGRYTNIPFKQFGTRDNTNGLFIGAGVTVDLFDAGLPGAVWELLVNHVTSAGPHFVEARILGHATAPTIRPIDSVGNFVVGKTGTMITLTNSAAGTLACRWGAGPKLVGA